MINKQNKTSNNVKNNEMNEELQSGGESPVKQIDTNQYNRREKNFDRPQKAPRSEKKIDRIDQPVLNVLP